MTTPKKYRKKPVTIESMEWDGTAEGATTIIDWVLENGGSARWDEPHGEIRHELPDGTVLGCPAYEGGMFIRTLEGTHLASPGEYIIKGVAGEFYPCKPDIFAATYEEAEGMATNIDRAAEVVANELYKDPVVNHELFGDEHVALAHDLADAGLLAPDLPEPHTFPNGEREWDILDGWVNLDTDGTITVVYDERDEDDIAAGAEIASGELVFTKPVAARDLVLAFLAATNHAQREETNE